MSAAYESALKSLSETSKLFAPNNQASDQGISQASTQPRQSFTIVTRKLTGQVFGILDDNIKDSEMSDRLPITSENDPGSPVKPTLKKK